MWENTRQLLSYGLHRQAGCFWVLTERWKLALVPCVVDLGSCRKQFMRRRSLPKSLMIRTWNCGPPGITPLRSSSNSKPCRNLNSYFAFLWARPLCSLNFRPAPLRMVSSSQSVAESKAPWKQKAQLLLLEFLAMKMEYGRGAVNGDGKNGGEYVFDICVFFPPFIWFYFFPSPLWSWFDMNMAGMTDLIKMHQSTFLCCFQRKESLQKRCTIRLGCGVECG